jgi:hypothetical protein
MPIQCDTDGCKSPRKKGRRICETHYHIERKRQRRYNALNAKECATLSCHRKTSKDHCQGCARDLKNEILRNTRKLCKACQKVKPLIDYGVRAAADDGRCATCRECSYKRHQAAQERKRAREADGGHEAMMRRAYWDQHETLGFSCSQLLSMPMRNEIPPEWMAPR